MATQSVFPEVDYMTEEARKTIANMAAKGIFRIFYELEEGGPWTATVRASSPKDAVKVGFDSLPEAIRVWVYGATGMGMTRDQFMQHQQQEDKRLITEFAKKAEEEYMQYWDSRTEDQEDRFEDYETSVCW